MVKRFCLRYEGNHIFIGLAIGDGWMMLGAFFDKLLAGVCHVGKSWLAGVADCRFLNFGVSGLCEFFHD